MERRISVSCSCICSHGNCCRLYLLWTEHFCKIQFHLSDRFHSCCCGYLSVCLPDHQQAVRIKAWKNSGRKLSDKDCRETSGFAEKLNTEILKTKDSTNLPDTFSDSIQEEKTVQFVTKETVTEVPVLIAQNKRTELEPIQMHRAGEAGFIEQTAPDYAISTRKLQRNFIP